ncbi:protein translocase subunit SecD [Luteitalea sp. TBR-22]|uniref:protein translocase subunit SecD n=1 Tax=Luteitalea sp. TBR-22 TaxID=2802971 RepID=UPI001AF67C73|nr:protein translocase subunit SecD [Luteitalea sp. TBR-22]BCS35585.1 protein translocase subunit SecD [Luteitalea sp. TBR-22]
MTSNLRWKVIAILVVVALAVAAFYPPKDKVKLGLDLKGGVHLVLRVQTDDALKLETETSAERLRDELSRQGVSIGAVTPQDVRSFRVDGVPGDRDADFRRIADEWVGQVFDRASGVGGSYTFTLKSAQITRLRQEAVAQALQTIERRVNELGVAEPIVAPHGDGDQILVQMPGVTDVARAKEIIRSTALLELKIVEDGPAPTREALLAARGGQVPPDLEIVPGAAEAGNAQGTGPVYYLVKRVAGITGRDLRNARPSLDENNQPAVGFSLNQQGADKFSQLTAQNIGRQLAIILDGRVQSAPTIEGRIYDQGRISGSFTQQEVQDLSLTLRSGALPASLTYLEERTVGPSLGADSIRAGVMASLIGLGFVTLFMLAYYKLTGFNALLSISLNLLILLGFMAYIGAVMTLPGIAGFILTIGMGVDSNVLIFERIKEEMGSGKSARAAVAAGFDRVFLTILDTHVASLISAAFLFQFGTGPIRGFATTLFFGLLSNVFTAVFVSRTLFELILSRRPQAAKLSI